jgi:nitrate/nitrite transporter NarK
MKKEKLGLRERRGVRWLVLAMVSMTMLWFYYLTDALAPLQAHLEVGLGWSAMDYGLYSGAYGWLNVFLLMLVFGGMMLDRMGVRFTGILAIGLLLLGAGVKYWAVSGGETEVITLRLGSLTLASARGSALWAGAGFAIFGVGAELFGLTANKAIIRWFGGKELALALGLNVSVGRIGTALAMFTPVPLVAWSGSLATPILVSIWLLCVGLLLFFLFAVFDRRLDREVAAARLAEGLADEEKFRWGDLLAVVRIKAFWIISALCVLFYSGLFPFIKYATMLVVQKFGVSDALAGLIPALLPLGALVLTPVFGGVYDRKGRGATIMIVGSGMLLAVHLLFAVPALDSFYVAIGLVLLLGISFSAVPAAMWPSLAKIIPEQRIGTAYAITFWIQNWGIMGVPMLIGFLLDRFCVVGVEKRVVNGAETMATLYDYTLPMLVFASFGALAIVFALWLRREDARMGYGLEKPNLT